MRPLLRAAQRDGDEVVVAAPHALSDMVAESGFAFRSCGEPSEGRGCPDP